MQQYEEFSFHALKELPIEERTEKLREALESDSLRTVLFDASENKSIDLKELVDTVGMEKVIDMLNEVIDHLDSAQTIKATHSDIKKALEAFENGTATPEQMLLIKAFTEHMNGDTSMAFTHCLIDVILDFVSTVQNDDENPYQPTIKDLITTTSLVSLISMANDSNTRLSVFGTAKNVMDVVTPVADKILEVFTDSLTDNIDSDVLVSALIIAAAKVAGEDMKIISADKIRGILKKEDDDIDEVFGDEEHVEEEIKPQKANGSNKKKPSRNITQPNIVKPKTNQEMKNLLQD